MADNIKIVGNITNTTTVPRYSENDIKLIPSKKLQENFGGTGDYIEYYVYDAGGNLLNSNYNYLSYKLPTNTGLTPGVNTPPNTAGSIQTTNVGIDSTLATPTSSLYPIIEIDPVQDLQNLGYSSGEFITKYLLFQNKISDFTNEALFIKEISPDRTELRLASTILTNEQIESGSLELINEVNTADYYVDYLLNFGDNNQVVAVNVALNKAPEGYEILFKLYQPLPLSIVEKTTLWVVEEKVSPYNFDINLDKLITPAPGPTLRGPNFDIEIPNNGTVSTQYNTYGNLVSNLQSLQNSSYQQILNLLATQSVDINIDYSNYDNFVFFGSANQRLTNFYNKVKEIEDYNTLITTYTPLTSSRPSLITEINKYSSSINTIITQFDGFEYYLYYESGSTLTSSLDYSITPYPKSGSLKPFTLLPTGSSSASVWYNWATGSAKNYDLNNYDNLEYAIPTFVKDDTHNQPFLTFLNMVGQYFDNIWIYLNSITDINLANNNLEVGISKDLVYERLKSLGVHLYNSQAGEDVDQYLIGANTGSSAWNNNTTITGSYLNNIPRKDLVSELYKRIYHNLPLLAKTKGTVAGLDNLMTVFGIPNQTYYTIGSQSFYTPTGSSVTASILSVKEFGGSLKSNLINGYNNDKVRIVSNTITGSVLSPLLSLQTFPTASSAFRDDDMNYIDISFSPETQMDTYISGAIASNNPTWSLDDYIGDPRQQYNSSYPDLDAQRKLYFETGVPGFRPFTGSLLDYNGFIRLIQYFDNSLFKMLNDFVPERTSLSTGVTINSPVLERNKVAYANPTNSTTQSVYEAEYSASTISSTYGTFYNALSSSNNTMGWYDGELSGSTVNVYQYFTDNYNPYLQPTGTINQNAFEHSDWNVLLNNVSKSVVSNVRQRIEYIDNFLPTSSILTPAELQDSYLTLRSYNTSRYEGSKTTSLLYNTYTSGSYIGSDGFTVVTGDDSFGKTAAIDRNVRQIGLFTRIESSSVLLNRNLVSLKYLVDEFGGLTELNQRNDHWENVQRIFLRGNTTNISLFDNKKFSNQKITDGNKPIFESGYAYYPIIYNYTSGSNAKRMYFVPANSTTYDGYATFESSSYYITGGITNNYPLSNNYVTNIFNRITQGQAYLSLSSPVTTASIYTVPERGNYNINPTVRVQVTVPANYAGSASFQLEISGSGTSFFSFDSSSKFNFILPSASPPTAYTPVYQYFGGTSTVTISGTSVTSARPIPIGGGQFKSDWFEYNFTNQVFISNGGGTCTLSNSIGFGPFYALSSTITFTWNKNCTPANGLPAPNNPFTCLDNLYDIPDFNVPNGSQSQTRTYTINETKTLNQNDKIFARIKKNYVESTIASVYTASIVSEESNFRVKAEANIVGNYPFASPYFFTISDAGAAPTYIGSNQIALTASFASFYSPNYTFLPIYTSGSGGNLNTYSSSLYNQFGDVNYPFQIEPFDIFIAYNLVQNIYFESKILKVEPYTATGEIILTLDSDLNFQLRWGLEPGYDNGASGPPLTYFLIVKRVKDETSVFATFNQPPGQTSYGFIIPQNLATDVLANIDTITKEVKQKLLADQQGQT